MACCLSLSKNFTFFINCLIFILSIVVGTGCILILTKTTAPIEDLAQVPKASVVSLLVGSVILCLVSFCGCCGAAKSSPCLLVTYAVVLFIFAIFDSVITAVIMEFCKDVEKLFEKALDEMIKDYPANATGIDNIQKSLECCGSRSLDSWSEYYKQHNYYPASCCKNGTETCLQPFERPCMEILSRFFETGGNVIAISGISIAVVLFVSSISSCLLARAFVRQKRDSIIDSNRYYGRITV